MTYSLYIVKVTYETFVLKCMWIVCTGKLFFLLWVMIQKVQDMMYLEQYILSKAK